MGQDDQNGKGQSSIEVTPDRHFDTLKSQDVRNERRIFWSEVAIILVTALLVTAYLMAWWFTIYAVPAAHL